jgi:hypothetical protein
MLGILFYTLLVGASASVLRAAIMGCFAWAQGSAVAGRGSTSCLPFTIPFRPITSFPLTGEALSSSSMAEDVS